MIRKLANSIQMPTMSRAGEYLSPRLESGERILAAGWCAPPDYVQEPTALVTRIRTRDAGWIRAGLLSAALTIAVVMAAVIAAIISRQAAFLAVALIALLVGGLVSLVVTVFMWLAYAADIGDEAATVARIRTRYRAGGYPSWYVAVTDRRLMMLGADSWSKKPRPDDFWSCPLANVHCIAAAPGPRGTVLEMSINGAQREYAISNEFEPLARALSAV
jgi:hypothetical protein